MDAYVELNLLLMDPQAFPHNDHRYTGDWENAACGWGPDAHPVWLTDHIRPAFEGRSIMKPITAEVLQILRDHCAKLFRCLHSISGPNRATEPDFIVSRIAYLFKFRGDLDLCRKSNPDAFKQ